MHPIAVELLKSVDRKWAFTLVDVGSMGGIESEWEPLGDHLRVIGFEPDDREFAKLQPSSSHTFLNCALAGDVSPLSFFVSREPGKSSIYPPNFDCLRQFPWPERFETVETVVIPSQRVLTLDGALLSSGVQEVDFAKLDTQGSELSILQGGLWHVGHTLLGVKIEVEFLEMYCGQPLFADVDVFMRAHGFQLMDLRRAFWKREVHTDFPGKGQLVFGDALYVRRLDTMATLLVDQPAAAGAAKYRKLAALCLVYGMCDFAVAALQDGAARGFLETPESERWVETIRRHDRRRGLRWLPGAGLFAYFLRRIEPKFARSHLGWADGDAYVGNR